MKLVALSDQHGFLPETPEGDVLIVAGDLCPDGFGGKWASDNEEGRARQCSWFDTEWSKWVVKQPAKRTIATWGNHDFCGHAYNPQPGGIIVDHEVVYDGIRFWLSPWSPTFMHWAWMASEEELAKKYALIPEGVDIIVSHSPPRESGDTFIEVGPGGAKQVSVGSLALLDAIHRVKPQVVICGHIHSGRGVYDIGDTKVYNVSVVNESYKLVHEPVVIEVSPR